MGSKPGKRRVPASGFSKPLKKKPTRRCGSPWGCPTCHGIHWPIPKVCPIGEPCSICPRPTPTEEKADGR